MSAAPSIPESTATVEAARAALLYERYSRRILGYCRRRLSSQEDAEDAVQHTFLNAYRSLRTGVEPRAEAAWLYKIAENVCHERRRSAWRRSRFEAVSSDGELRQAVVEPAPANDELDGLADALAQLTDNQRRAILLREWQGLSYREIAAELETTESAVETLLFRARRALARRLDRTRAWAGIDAGSVLAWAKSLLGGAGLKVGAATVVVAAGVTAAEPALRSEPPPIPAHSAKPVAPAVLPAPSPVFADSPAAIRHVAAHRPKPAAPSDQRKVVRRTGRTSIFPGHRPGAGAGAPAASPSPAPAPAPASTPVPAATVPVETAMPPPVHVQVPPVAPLPLPPVTVTVTVPPVPSVAPLDLPALPRLP
jgi:RNA polymerase sigma factor (sigma-70 family)